jgi:hypothetical protein
MSDSCGTQRRSWRLPEGSLRARWSAIGRMSRAISRRTRGSYTFVQGVYDFTREDVSLSEYRKPLPGAFRLQPLRQPGEFDHALSAPISSMSVAPTMNSTRRPSTRVILRFADDAPPSSVGARWRMSTRVPSPDSDNGFDPLTALGGASFLGEEVGGRAGTASPMQILRCTRKGIAGLRLSYCGEKPLSARLMPNSPRVKPDGFCCSICCCAALS